MKYKPNKGAHDLLNLARMAFADNPGALASLDKLEFKFEIDSYKDEDDDTAKMTPEGRLHHLKMKFHDDPATCAFLDLFFENRNSLEGLEDGAPDAIEMKRKRGKCARGIFGVTIFVH